MKKYLAFSLLICCCVIATAQTVTVRDHRAGSTTTDSSQIVNDHRTSALVDMSSSLTQPVFEEMIVYRIQLRLKTGIGNGAGTDDPVYVKMNDADDVFYLVKGIDNFVEGKTVTYDVLSRTIKKISDIKYIKFGVKGNDGVCISKVELLINNCQSPLYATSISTSLGTCIDNGEAAPTGISATPTQIKSSLPATFTIASSSLRGTSWNFAGQRKDMWRPPVKLEKAWVVSAVEASIGNQIYQEGGELKWGTHGGRLENNTLFGDAVEATRKDAHTLKFDLDLERDIAGPNPEVDVDFELDFRCEEGRIIVGALNVVTSSDAVGSLQNFLRSKAIKIVGVAVGLFVPFPAPLIAPVATGFLLNAFSFSMKIDPANPNLSMSCRETLVQSNGDILLR